MPGAQLPHGASKCVPEEYTGLRRSVTQKRCTCSAQGDAWGGDTGVGYMNELIVSCATVKDPSLPSISLDLARQCVNVSLSRDGLVEVRSPFPLVSRLSSAHAQARLHYVVFVVLGG